jgi:hypothetical protein
MQQSSNPAPSQPDTVPIGDPETTFDSKKVALRAERHDELRITEVIDRYQPDGNIPDSFLVAERTQTYYGPKLVLEAGSENYLVTVPGPESQLLLWRSEPGANGFQKGWSKLAEVGMEFGEELPQYDLCPYCGDPLKTLEHERMAGFGGCVTDTALD